jgi:DNA gyrase subunit B
MRGGKKGTQVRFMPSEETFSNIDFERNRLLHRLRELAFLNSGVQIVLRDERDAEPFEEVLEYEGGVAAFVKHLDRTKTAIFPDPVLIAGEREGVTVEAALEWNDSYHENVLCFTNNIPQRDGGTHLAGFRGALTRVVNQYAGNSGIATKAKVVHHRRRCARGPDLRSVGESAGPEILLARPRTSWSPPRCARRWKARSMTR